ncbi:MFS transporter [Halovulum marinum]|nr:MFS transporter [Halovulum marinum]
MRLVHSLDSTSPGAPRPPRGPRKPLKFGLNLSAFRSRDFRLYLFGNAFSLQAMWIQRITFAWLAWQMSGSAAFVGLVAFLGFAPTMLSGPVFGALIDRVPLLPAARTAQALLFALALLTAGLHAAGLLGQGTLAALALGYGVVMSAHHPVRMSLAPLLAPRGSISSVIATTSINFNLARSIGPALGGALIHAGGPGAALWVVAACLLPYQIVLRLLRPRERAPLDEAPGSLLHGLAQGLRYAWRDRFTRLILLLTGGFALLGRGMLEILPLVADGLFARGPTGLGTLTSVAGLGALAAAALVIALPAPLPGRVPRASLVSAGLGVALTLVVALSRNWPVTVAAVAALGGAGTVLGVSVQSALQQALADGYRGRVMSLWVMTGIGGSALGALLLGGLADALGLAWAAAIVLALAALPLSMARAR